MTDVLDDCISSSAQMFIHALLILASCMMKIVISVGNIQNSDLLDLTHIVQRWIQKPGRLCGAWETWCLTSTETKRLIRDGKVGGSSRNGAWEEIQHKYTYCWRKYCLTRFNEQSQKFLGSKQREREREQGRKIYKHWYFKERIDRLLCLLLVLLSPVDHKGL